jgi:hypothetical protein
MKDISIQIGSGANSKVEVRLVQQAGELHVAVHTPDSDVARGLQQGLPDLVSKLQESGYRSESWRPADTSAPANAATTQPQSSSNHSRQQDAGTSSGWSQQQGGQRNRNQSDQPRWVEDLESSLKGGERA